MGVEVDQNGRGVEQVGEARGEREDAALDRDEVDEHQTHRGYLAVVLLAGDQERVERR